MAHTHVALASRLLPLIGAALLALASASGPAAAQAGIAHYILEGWTQDAKLGAAVARVPDLTGDGVDDIASGNHRADGPAGIDAGRVVLYDGATGGFLRALEGEQAGGLLGHDVWGIRDLDGDGRGDILAAAYRFSYPTRAQAGKVYVLSGKDLSLLWAREGEGPSDEFGYALGDVADLDGDRVDDVVVGAWLNKGFAYLAGRAYVYSGKTGALIRTHDGLGRDHRFGCSVAGLGDVDGDGAGDYAIGALQAGLAGQGEVYVFSGKTGTLLHTFTGERNGDMFGHGVARVPDIDGNGIDELLIGAPEFDTGPSYTIINAGRAYLHSLKTGSRLYVLDGENSWDKFGIGVAGLPDMDEDARGELAVGAYWHHGGGIVQTGAAYVYSGATGTRLDKYVGEEANNLFGFALCGLNDLNGDGRADLVVGAYQYRPNPGLTESYGRIYAYTKGLSATPSTLSATSGGNITLGIDTGDRKTARPYLLIATVSGNHPGLVLPHSPRVPINFDLFTIASWLYANSAILVNTYGSTSAAGLATAHFRAPPGLLGGYIGMRFTFAYALIDRLDRVSNPVAVKIVP
ncbi:MAG: FG-GAP repeat protein [Planctomycetes bacterium]|nr:FG-GAP repeat protein [Planctomycetota bacterium]